MNPKQTNLYTFVMLGWKADMKGGAEDQANKEAAFAQQLQGMMTQQFGKQNAILDRLNKVFFKYVENPQGFDPAEMAAMRTQATETNSSEFLAGERSFQNKAFVLGGRDLPSGAMLQAQLLLEGGRAQAEAGSQREITLADANLKRVNMFNAASILSGNAAMLNPVGYAGVASQTYHNSVNDMVAAQQNPMLAGILGGAFGMGSAFLTGGLSSLTSKPK
jgi:hypothetical protein